MLCKIYLERLEVTSQGWKRMAEDDSFRGQNNGPTLQGSKGKKKRDKKRYHKNNATRICHIKLKI